ncbi:isochorismatase family protein [Cohnella fermenti]|uniref:Isochorismatase family protein n=1 Tax=Cohnella fermenti TaxID=2565925 RepID=A0A4S4C8Y6_9BACL|nr:isochorismatase family protein [Cohnella fermenti]THF82241.1 isochorismatase family protein [Cohnella fermenti]
MSNKEASKPELKLDPKKTALVVIDLQKGIAATGRPAAPNSIETLVGNASKLAEAFTEKGAFVVLVRVSFVDGRDALRPVTDSTAAAMQPPQGWDEPIPEMARFEQAHVVLKRQWGAFFGTDLDLQLRRRGIDTIVLCGLSTSIGVDTTAREAFQLGYNQVFAVNAMTAMAKEEHDYVVGTMFPRMGRVRTAEEVVAALS